MSLDRIEITPFALIAGDLLQNRRTGTLTILRNSSRKTLYWSQGELVLIVPDDPADTLPDFLVRRGVMTPQQAVDSFRSADSGEAVSRFHETGLQTLSARQTLLREWLTSVFIPFFSLDDGTSAFTDEEAIDADRRVFVQSTAALILEGIRTITNGLILRRSIGDLRRTIEPARNSRFTIESAALTDTERRVAEGLSDPQTIEAFLKQFPADSVLAARVMIGMLALGIFAVVDEHASRVSPANAADMKRDLELLAAIGSNDPRSLRTIALSRQLPSLNHYEVLDVARASTRQQIISSAEAMKKKYDPSTFPGVVREAVQDILRRIDEATSVLQDASRRAAYDKLLLQSSGRGAPAGDAIQQRLTQRSIAAQNLNRARQLSVQGDYYGAIVLLRQAVAFAPDVADAWVLLGACQERNPKWRRDAAESFQMALSVDPNHVDALIALGDLYRVEGLATRAQTCYEDALKIAPENQQATSRLQALKKR